MTWKERLATAKEILWLVGILSPIIAFVLWLTVQGAWAIYGEAWIERAREVLGIEENAAAIRRLSGEDRVVLTQQGSAYVEEPVFGGQQIVANYVIRRTALGASCDIRKGVPLFEDSRRVPMPGTVSSPVRNFGTTWTPARITVQPPPDLMDGRNSMTVQVEYDCNGQSVTDALETVFFIQRPAPHD